MSKGLKCNLSAYPVIHKDMHTYTYTHVRTHVCLYVLGAALLRSSTVHDQMACMHGVHDWMVYATSAVCTVYTTGWFTPRVLYARCTRLDGLRHECCMHGVHD